MKQSDIVRYWHSVELLQPQSVPKNEKRKDDRDKYIHQLDVVGQVVLPWMPGNKLEHQRIAKEYEWHHQLYASCYDIKSAVDVLAKKFGANAGYTETPSQPVALYYLKFDADGRYVDDSAVLSSSAWMLGRLLSGATWHQGFDKAQQDLLAEAKQRLTGVVGAQAIEALSAWICSRNGLTTFFQAEPVQFWCMSTPFKATWTDKATDDPLNSFILKDLVQVAAELDRNTAGAALKSYLSSHDNARRTDVKKDDLAVIQVLHPGAYPAGCWPTENHLGLVHSQQVAVNRITQVLGRSPGLMSVNGPPGTGKTTLLRDIVASVVTARAEVLAGLDSPSQAFGKGDSKVEILHSNTKLSIWPLNSDLLGHEIVVASSNNGAVDNVSLEIPGVKGVDKGWLSEYDYFREIGTNVCGKPAWGLMSASLGNKSKRSVFLDQFWKHEAGMKSWLNKSSENLKGKADEKKALWKDAVNRFKSAKREADRAAGEAGSLGVHFDKLLAAVKSFKKATKDRDDAVEKITELKSRDNSLLVEQRRPAVILLEDAQDRFIRHQRLRPGFLKNLFTLWRAGRQWRRQMVALRKALDECQRKFSYIDGLVKSNLNEMNRAEVMLRGAQAELDRCDAEFTSRLKSVRELAVKLGAAHVLSWLDSGKGHIRDDIERKEPLLNLTWRKARARVFMEALNLHKVFIQIESTRVYSNLNTAIALLGGASFENVDQRAIRSAWATLCLVVPVLSSTFASFDRTFRTLKGSSIGWLLVDEAGQATPQAAVGAIWRAQRAVLVGDPLQLEPIMSVPDSVLEHMRNHYKVPQYWVPSKLSAQVLADAANPVGTMAGPEGAKQWVGLPLVVHRRCDRPMFEMANRIAYDGAMVYGTSDPSPEKRTKATLQTGWRNVSSPSQTNWVQAEGTALLALLAQLDAEGVPASSIYIITPFQAVRAGLKTLLGGGQYTVGTIHTMQGKESEVVIMVLGGRTDSPGARNWAVSQPNLLNVAVTRAKQRFYMIGDRADWVKRPLVGSVERFLPVI